jgi:hypothetical protein
MLILVVILMSQRCSVGFDAFASVRLQVHIITNINITKTPQPALARHGQAARPKPKQAVRVPVFNPAPR